MNDSFSLARFRMVAVKMLRENRVKLLLMTGVMLGSVIIMALLCGFSEYTDTIAGCNYWPEHEVRDEAAFGMMMLFVFGTIAGSMIFGNMSGKASRLSVLMVPATALEKFLVRLILFLPVFVIMYLGAFYLADLLRYLMMKCLFVDRPDCHPILFKLSFLLEDNSDVQMMKMYISCMIVSWSFFALGSALWERQAYLKTAFSLGLLCAVYTVIGVTAAEWFTPERTEAGGYIISINEFDNPNMAMNFMVSMAVVITIINYTLSYFRLRESEIINRW